MASGLSGGARVHRQRSSVGFFQATKRIHLNLLLSLLNIDFRFSESTENPMSLNPNAIDYVAANPGREERTCLSAVDCWRMFEFPKWCCRAPVELSFVGMEWDEGSQPIRRRQCAQPPV